MFIAGDRDTWKSPDNFFRQHKAIRINNVPTMGFWNGKKLTNKLSGDDEIGKSDQRKLLFEE